MERVCNWRRKWRELEIEEEYAWRDSRIEGEDWESSELKEKIERVMNWKIRWREFVIEGENGEG